MVLLSLSTRLSLVGGIKLYVYIDCQQLTNLFYSDCTTISECSCSGMPNQQSMLSISFSGHCCGFLIVGCIGFGSACTIIKYCLYTLEYFHLYFWGQTKYVCSNHLHWISTSHGLLGTSVVLSWPFPNTTVWVIFGTIPLQFKSTLPNKIVLTTS